MQTNSPVIHVNWYNVSRLVHKLSITLRYLPGTYFLMCL